jgi:hypothetical protein
MLPRKKAVRWLYMHKGSSCPASNRMIAACLVLGRFSVLMFPHAGKPHVFTHFTFSLKETGCELDIVLVYVLLLLMLLVESTNMARSPNLSWADGGKLRCRKLGIVHLHHLEDMHPLSGGISIQVFQRRSYAISCFFCPQTQTQTFSAEKKGQNPEDF